jgi:uncharacterized protein (TIGR02117 family)
MDSLSLRRPGRLTPPSLCICALLCGCAELPAGTGTWVAPEPSAPANRPLEIGVLVAGWHTGIVLPAGELGPLGSLREDPRARYLSFGWGNRRFYMATHPDSGAAVAALFPSPSALFVQALSAPTDLLGEDARIHWVCADPDELSQLASYIERSLSESGGKPIDLGAGPLPDSRFYASTGHYSAVHTCNTWTVAALQYAELPVRAGGVLFARQVDSRVGALRACPAPRVR